MHMQDYTYGPKKMGKIIFGRRFSKDAAADNAAARSTLAAAAVAVMAAISTRPLESQISGAQVAVTGFNEQTSSPSEDEIVRDIIQRVMNGGYAGGAASEEFTMTVNGSTAPKSSSALHYRHGGGGAKPARRDGGGCELPTAGGERTRGFEGLTTFGDAAHTTAMLSASGGFRDGADNAVADCSEQSNRENSLQMKKQFTGSDTGEARRFPNPKMVAVNKFLQKFTNKILPRSRYPQVAQQTKAPKISRRWKALKGRFLQSTASAKPSSSLPSSKNLRDADGSAIRNTTSQLAHLASSTSPSSVSPSRPLPEEFDPSPPVVLRRWKPKVVTAFVRARERISLIIENDALETLVARADRRTHGTVRRWSEIAVPGGPIFPGVRVIMKLVVPSSRNRLPVCTMNVQRLLYGEWQPASAVAADGVFTWRSIWAVYRALTEEFLGSRDAVLMPQLSPDLKEACHLGGKRLLAEVANLVSVSTALFVTTILKQLTDIDPHVVHPNSISQDKDYWEIVMYLARASNCLAADGLSAEGVVVPTWCIERCAHKIVFPAKTSELGMWRLTLGKEGRLVLFEAFLPFYAKLFRITVTRTKPHPKGQFESDSDFAFLPKEPESVKYVVLERKDELRPRPICVAIDKWKVLPNGNTELLEGLIDQEDRDSLEDYVESYLETTFTDESSA